MRDYLLRFGIAFIPIMAAAHAVKSLLKTTSRIPYWGHAVADPLGIETARGILDQTTQLTPVPLWINPVLTVLSLVLMGVGVALSLIVVHKLIAEHLPESGLRSVLFYLIPGLYGGMFIFMLFAWRLGLLT